MNPTDIEMVDKLIVRSPCDGIASGTSGTVIHIDHELRLVTCATHFVVSFESIQEGKVIRDNSFISPNQLEIGAVMQNGAKKNGE